MSSCSERVIRRRLALHVALAALLAPVGRVHAQAAQDDWSGLTDAQRAVLAPFRTQWNEWSAEERSIWLRLADQFPEFDEARREQAFSRIREWARLTPAQREVARHNFRLARSLNRDARAREWERYNSMTPEQRSVLRAHPLFGNAVMPSQSSQPLSVMPQRR